MLLPEKAVGIGQTWEHEGPVLAGLLGLEAVHQSDAKSTLVAVQEGIAKMELSGSVSGAVGGVAADVQIEANYSFDLAKKRITHLALSIREDRAIGHAAPGLDVTARVRMTVSPLRESPP